MPDFEERFLVAFSRRWSDLDVFLPSLEPAFPPRFLCFLRFGLFGLLLRFLLLRLLNFFQFLWGFIHQTLLLLYHLQVRLYSLTNLDSTSELSFGER